jgi:hypothetical protein
MPRLAHALHQRLGREEIAPQLRHGVALGVHDVTARAVHHVAIDVLAATQSAGDRLGLEDVAGDAGLLQEPAQRESGYPPPRIATFTSSSDDRWR